MISTPFWTGTGFMKWVEMTREEALRSVGSCVKRVRIERIGMTVQQQEDVGGSAACAGKAADAG